MIVDFPLFSFFSAGHIFHQFIYKLFQKQPWQYVKAAYGVNIFNLFMPNLFFRECMFGSQSEPNMHSCLNKTLFMSSFSRQLPVWKNN